MFEASRLAFDPLIPALVKAYESMPAADTLRTKTAEQVALLKVDVEGFEKFVFEGGHAMLKRTDCVYFEVWDTHFAKYDYTTDDVLDLLRRHGLVVLRFLAKDSVANIYDLQKVIADDFLERLGSLPSEAMNEIDHGLRLVLDLSS